ncbi:MAG TPA: polysaccharide deacetylase family protein [Candidatus Monoglobus merdigallinarum]|uniref:Polysaccharide deacetylase family protein n=1 Tax=Candidatus Monoglobus merdigallinarum TaxID=2838698 RepID=A0A9D1PPL0_9FIRM|nr:polysaccharide deacetylase family protein [Candidatus Monoglobus merdigallinarum]
MNRFRARRKKKRYRLIAVLVVVVLAAGVLLPYCLEPGIPVLMYHCVSEAPRGGDENLYCRPAQIEEELVYLNKNSYTTLFATEYEQAYSVSKPVILTFDDGYEDNYTELFPLLKEYNVKATIFVVSSYVDTEGYLSSAQIREMVDSGLVSVQSHTSGHVELTGLGKEELQEELRRSCAELAKITGRNVTAISYPGGYYNSDVIEEVERYFTYAYAIDTNKYSKSNHYEISRGGVFRNTTLEAFEKAIKTYSQRRICREYLLLMDKIFG